jgi:hypothetical protein
MNLAVTRTIYGVTRAAEAAGLHEILQQLGRSARASLRAAT